MISGERRAEPIRKLDRALGGVIYPRVHTARRGDKLIRVVNEYSVGSLETAASDPFDSRADVECRRVDDLPFEIARGRDQRGAFGVAGLLNAFLDPIRDRRARFAANMGLVRDALADGTARARTVARATMEQVRDALDLGYLEKFRPNGG